MEGLMLDGKAVVITGSGRGLGRAYAIAAAANGASVVINDVNADNAKAVVGEITSKGGRAESCVGSIAHPEFAKALIERCVSHFGRIDALVNNAAVHGYSSGWDVDPQMVREMFEVNVLGTIFCGSAAIGAMGEQGSGVVVNVTSGSFAGNAHMPLYSATKGAVVSLTLSWSQAAAPQGIRVTAFSPVANTPMGNSAPGSLEPECIAPAMVYAISDRAQGLQGQIMRFDGRSLSIIRPPSFSSPTLFRTDWDLESIAQAMSDSVEQDAIDYSIGSESARKTLFDRLVT